MDIVLLFKNHPSHMSEIFWERVQHFLKERQHLLYSDLHDGYLSTEAKLFSDAIHRKCPVLRRCIGFMDGTVLVSHVPGTARIRMPHMTGISVNTL